MSSSPETKPGQTQGSLEMAIQLARSGDKHEAAERLREIVAAQPGNQAAWLWLSAIAAEQAEAEAALAQAKKIDPAHPSLKRAEQWLVNRFSDQPETRQNRTVETPVPPSPSPAAQPTTTRTAPGPFRPNQRPDVPPPPEPLAAEPEETGQRFRLFNALAFGAAVAVVVLGLVILFFGLVFEVSGSALAYDQSPEAAQADQIAQVQAQLDAARANQDFAAAISHLESLRQLQPAEPAIIQQLARAHLQQGLSLRNRGFVNDALTHFQQADGLAPDQPHVQREIELAQAYVDGTSSYQEGQWAAAIAHLDAAWQQDKTYINVRDLLYSAYYNHGLAQQAAGEFADARQAFEAAAAMRPDLSEARRLLAELEFELAPRTPADLPSNVNIEDRLILVGIAEQRMKVYNGDEVVFDFVVSTGEPGRDTAVGEFEILNKIDMAYASTWNLDMPYWMGIYWAGPLQNGIHSLPIVKHTGYKLWDGYLGQRVSYGCIILSDEDAATLYEWTEIGTKVKIVPSIVSWSPEAE